MEFWRFFCLILSISSNSSDTEEADETEKSAEQSSMCHYVYKCPDCEKLYKSISGFRGHMRNKHKKSQLKGTVITSVLSHFANIYIQFVIYSFPDWTKTSLVPVPFIIFHYYILVSQRSYQCIGHDSRIIFRAKILGKRKEKL